MIVLEIHYQKKGQFEAFSSGSSRLFNFFSFSRAGIRQCFFHGCGAACSGRIRIRVLKKYGPGCEFLVGKIWIINGPMEEWEYFIFFNIFSFKMKDIRIWFCQDRSGSGFMLRLEGSISTRIRSPGLSSGIDLFMVPLCPLC